MPGKNYGRIADSVLHSGGRIPASIRGLGREQCSRLAEAVCSAAGRNGRTVRAAELLAVLAPVIDGRLPHPNVA